MHMLVCINGVMLQLPCCHLLATKSHWCAARRDDKSSGGSINVCTADGCEAITNRMCCNLITGVGAQSMCVCVPRT